MQPREYLAIFLKRWPIIAGVVIIAVVASFIFSRLQTPIYRATVFLTVSPSRIDYGQIMSMENLLRQNSRMLTTDKLAEIVNARLNLDLPIDRLREKARVSAVSEDLLLMLEVDDTDANRARDISFAWADEFSKFHQNRMAAIDPRDRIEVDLLDKPPPAVLNWPKRNQIMSAAAVLGLLLGTMLVFALEFLDDTIKDPKDIDRYVGLPVIGSIPAWGTATAKVGSANGHQASRRLPALPGSRR